MITADTAFRMPAAPRTIEETGLSPDLILQIVTKTSDRSSNRFPRGALMKAMAANMVMP